MRTLILFSIVFIISATSLAIAKHGKHCKTNQDCLGSISLVCHNHKCVCPVGQAYDNGQCKPFSLKKCHKNHDCQDIDSNRMCNKTNRCVCRNITYENTDGWCKSAYNLTCQSNANCFGFNCTKQQTNESIIATGNEQFTGKCRCPVGTLFNYQTKKCIDFHRSKCYSNPSCQDADPNRFCAGTHCFCKPKMYENITTKWCLLKKSHNETCQNINECSGFMSCQRTHSWESHKRCRCQNGFQWSKDRKDCVPFKNAVCLQDIDCQDADPKMICVTKSIIMTQNKTIVRRQCQCLPGHRLNSSNYCTLGANRNEFCHMDSDCKKNMTCDFPNYDAGYQCRCQTNYLWSIDEERCVRFEDGNCWSSTDCQDKDSNLHCGARDKCECKEGYKLNKNNNQCEVASLYTTCSDDIDCPISGSVCNKDLTKNRCTCSQTHKFSPADNACIRMTCKKHCVSNDYVEDSRMKCSFGSCWCKNSLGEFSGYCMTPDDSDDNDYDPDETSTTDPFVQPVEDDYSEVWAFVLGSLLVGGILSFVAMAVRVSRAARMQREMERQLESGETIGTVSSQFNSSPDFVLDERPPQYSELAERPPSYSVSVNPK